MRFIRSPFLFILIGLLVIGCGKKAGIAGRVVDWKGQPMSEVKVIAKQVLPMKGYKQFETTTNSDGMFNFNKVFPKSEYALFLLTEKWKTEQRIVVQSGSDGQTYTLPFPIVVRFMISHDGVIKDSKTGMQWIPSPDYTFSWDGATNYAQKLTLGGYSDWRLPTRAELHQLYDASSRDEIEATFHTSRNSWVWSSEFHDSLNAWRLDLRSGSEDFIFRGNSIGTMAMVAVHSPR